MQIRFLLGPAGTGKTCRCLAEVRQALTAAPEGPALLFIAPKQATYQLERQLLGDAALTGYSRLRILSFERLARFVFEQRLHPLPELLDDEGRVMVLRGLLAQKRGLKLFRASARLTGFAQQLSQVLSELQRDQLTPEQLRALARRMPAGSGLALKLEDLATILCDYLAWLEAHHLQDAGGLLSAAARLLRTGRPADLRIESLWLDGFAEFSRQELDILAALLPSCRQATLAFCLDPSPARKVSWLSSWTLLRRTYESCREHLAAVPGADLITEVLPRDPGAGRFGANPVFQHLEQFWPEPKSFTNLVSDDQSTIHHHLRLAACVDPEAEAGLAAREILRHVRGGGRFREAAVLVRDLGIYQQVIQRVFARYEIPCFIDRREGVAHHPLAELCRSALRTVALGWRHDDLFAALKTGLIPADDAEIDRLENEALARGWQGSAWQKPLVVPGDPQQQRWLIDLQQRVLPPFQRLALAVASEGPRLAGPPLARALRDFWRDLDLEERLQQWAAIPVGAGEARRPASVHATVWDQMNLWLQNLDRAFPTEALPLREWLPILEAGLSSLSVGVIPPALDQVLVGAVDRSRNPDLKLVLVLGLNEGVFPARPAVPALLTEADRVELQRHNVLSGSGCRHQMGRERFFAYIACTRARNRLVLSYSLRAAHGAPLNPSPFVSHFRRLFPSLPAESVAPPADARDTEHVSELIGLLLRRGRQPPAPLRSLPAVADALERVRQFQSPDAGDQSLSPAWAARLYGPVLRTSVSRLEQFAACPFKFFVHSGLRAEERKLFELDLREQGSFQHEVLALFHEELRQLGKRWRDATPAEARERIGAIARKCVASYRDGLLQVSEQTRFLASTMTETLQDFVATLVDWMRTQYAFDPVAVELAYGDDGSVPAWGLDLDASHRLELRGRIDRVDLCRLPGDEAALCVVIDYKSSRKQLDPVLLAHGLQLQLLAYLNVLRRWPEPRRHFNVARLVPVGVFYVNLRGRPPRDANRRAALADPLQARKLACRHAGRFDVSALRQLDGRPDAQQGDQFNYRLAKTGQVYKNSPEALPSADFKRLLDSVETHLIQMGRRIYAGDTEVSPFRKGSQLACDQCDYRAICRIDPWSHRYRVLRLPEVSSEKPFVP